VVSGVDAAERAGRGLEVPLGHDLDRHRRVESLLEGAAADDDDLLAGEPAGGEADLDGRHAGRDRDRVLGRREPGGLDLERARADRRLELEAALAVGRSPTTSCRRR
jgi:hypothetical protein